MLVNKLILTNIKSHKYTEIDFLPGVNAILGENGSGKTTVLEAIGAVLFQSLDYKQTQFITTGQKKGSIHLTFNHNGKDYTAVKTYGSNSEHYILHGDERIADGSTEINLWLHQLLKIEQKVDLTRLFEDVIGVQQGSHTAHFLLPPATRKKIFDPLLNIEIYAQTWTRLLKVFNISKEKIQNREVYLAELKGKTSDYNMVYLESKEVEKELVFAEGNLIKQKAHYDELGAEHKELEAQRTINERLPVLESNWKSFQQRYNELETQLEEIKQAKEDIEDIKMSVERQEKIEENLKKLDEKLWYVQLDEKDLRVFRPQLKEMEGERKRLLGSLDDYEDVARIVRKKDEIQNNWSESKTKKDEIYGQIGQLEEYEEFVSNYTCPIIQETCPKAGLDKAFKKILMDKKDKAELCEKHYNTMVKAHNELQLARTKFGELKSNKERVEFLNTQIKTHKNHIKELELRANEGNQYQAKMLNLKKELKQLDDPVLQHHDLKKKIGEEEMMYNEKSSIELQIKKVKEEINEIKGKTKSFDIAALNAITEAFNKQGVLCGQLQEQFDNLTTHANLVEKRLKAMDDIRNDIDKLTKELTILSETGELITASRDIFKKIPDHLVEQYLYHINSEANSIFSELNYRSGNLVWKNNYELSVDGRSFNQLSGGEQVLSALAVRLALLKNLTSINIAIFDEPTINLDQTHRGSLAETINGIKGFNQLFVISHDESFDSVIDNIVYVEKVNGISKTR